MIHSILIPHRNRSEQLRWTVWSIQRSAEICRIDEYEILVINAGKPTWGTMTVRGGKMTRMVDVLQPMPVFNKPKLYNLGIELAGGDVLTFLDADMLVGDRWMEGVKALEDPSIIRLCYRVRNLDVNWAPRPGQNCTDAWHQRMFLHWDDFPQTMECYGSHNRNKPDYGRHPWGNSQFSVTRENLGDLRYDERYEGKGREDLEFNRQFERRYGDRYKGHIRHEPGYSLLHMPHDHDNLEEWSDPKYAKRHIEMYEAE